MHKISLLLLGLLSQDVTVISVVTLNLSCSGEGKTLLCTGVGFLFWHCFVNY